MFVTNENSNKSNLVKNIISKPAFLNLILVLIQLIIILYVATFLGEHLKSFFLGNYIISIVLILLITARDQNIAYKMSWIVPITFFPAASLVMYLVMNVIPHAKKITLKLSHEESLANLFLKPDFEKSSALIAHMDAQDSAKSLLKFLHDETAYPAYTHTKAVYIPEGNDIFEQMLADFKTAERYIFMEFFIVSDGKLLRNMLDILSERIQNGVKVKLLYDGTNEFMLPKGFDTELRDIGIDVKIFSPVTPIVSTYQNNRDHRKIVVIDGKTAYTGGMNLADEYANLKTRFGYWKDSAVRLQGPAVKSMLAQLLSMDSLIAGPSKEEYSAYLNYEPEIFEEESGLMTPFSDTPGDEVQTCENIILHMLYNAKDYVYITSPYMLTDNEIFTAIVYAAKRGVDVRIIVPEIPDKKIPFHVNQSYYPMFFEAGVKIYQYLPGFIHAKTYVSDDKVAMVGTVNLDYRSLYLHFENAVLFTDCKVCHEVKEDFLKTVDISRLMDMESYSQLPLYTRAFGRVMRIFAPLM